MRTSRRPASAAAFALGLATLTMVASGCAIASPTTITTPYAAGNGTNAEIGTVKLLNFLAVSAAEGKPGVVVGALSTDSTQPVRVRMVVLDDKSQSALGEVTVNVRPGALSSVGVGTDATAFQLSNVPVQPGAVLTLRAATDEGRVDLSLPVLAPQNEYATITPSATSS